MNIINPADLSAIDELYVPLEHVCDGYDEQWDNCANLPKCGPCTPRDCVFGEWGEWFLQGGCTGLQLRQREVQVSNNQCGKPCNGPLTETAVYVLDKCKPHGKDCLLGAWGRWSQCADEKDQASRTREIKQYPEEGGADCEGSLEETKPCGGPPDTDCHVGDWHEWTSCSVTCGEGRYTRMRYVDVEAHHGGMPCNDDLLETSVCEVQACPGQECEVGEWNEWTMCDEMFTQRFRHREVLKEPSGSGKPCDFALSETDGCPRPPAEDCLLSDWQMWSNCDHTCDGGQTFRTRTMKQAATSGGTCPNSQLKEAAPCNVQACSPNGPRDCTYEEWSRWTPCSATCGDGSQKRRRKISEFATAGGKPCDGALEEVSVCKTHQCQVVDCRWSKWEQWSSCSVSCDGGTKTRTRNIAVAPEGGLSCQPQDKVEAAPCNVQMCGEGCKNGKWGEWREWSPCSGSCNDAYRYRRRNIAVHPNYCGNATEGVREEFEMCDDLPECSSSQDCEVSEWSQWTACSCHCFGMRHRSRYISKFPAGDGIGCFNESLKEITPCNPGPSQNTPMDCTNDKQQDCKMKTWESWSQCSTTCGGGQQSRIREVMQNAMGGGKPCSSTLLETKGCNMQHCEASRCQDCRWSPWSKWGACPACGGQTYRHRNIEVMPNYCGRRCTPHSAKQVSDCPIKPECRKKLYCAWSKWTPKKCNAMCGRESTVITRSLGLQPYVSPGAEVMFDANDQEKCAGTQLNFTECPFTHECSNCIPIPCEFSPWAEWQEPTCTGLCVRSRIIQDVNNECGEPCSGPLTETKRCKADCMTPRDCKLSAWSDWSGCTDPGQTNGQRYRSREIDVTPAHGGNPCLGILEQTIGCHQQNPQPCTFAEWGVWGQCSNECGEGWHTRTRTIQTHAQRGGLMCSGGLRELDKCSRVEPGCGSSEEKPCIMSDWGKWSTCDINHMQFRDKNIKQMAANGGSPCQGQTNEGRSCGFEPVDCKMSAWTRWGECDRSCGVGQSRRQRQISVFNKNGGRECPASLMETKGCQVKPCPIINTEVSDWNNWEVCSKTCGPGLQLRKRTILRTRSAGGRGYEGVIGEARGCHDTAACPKSDCVWGQWGQWSACTCLPGHGGGSRFRSRHISAWPQGGGRRCEAEDLKEQEACNTGMPESDCVDGQWGEWTAWTECTATCDGGTTTRTRRVLVQANECGCPAPGKSKEIGFCNVDNSCEASVDCRMSHWTEWTTCSATCNGIKRRSRTVEQYGRGAGAYCLGALKEVSNCNPSPGEQPVEQCAGGIPVDCKETDWTQWSVCSVSCGGGQHMRTREIMQHPKFGGKKCDGSIADLKECNRNTCGGPQPVDCQFGAWETWSVCDKCSGERTRSRTIISLPKYGGQECSPKDTEEVGQCPRRCAEQKYCEWAEWGAWSKCTVTCGLGGKRRRRRYLELTDSARAELPDYVSNVMNEYESLRMSFEKLSSNPLAETLLSAAAGCLCLLVAFAGVRACSFRRDGASQQRHAAVSSYSQLHPEMSAVQGLVDGAEVE